MAGPSAQESKSNLEFLAAAVAELIALFAGKIKSSNEG
jgi:hypothetical protein